VGQRLPPLSGGQRLLRLSDDAEGTKLWPTEAEQMEVEREEKERALARVAEYEAIIAKMRGA